MKNTELTNQTQNLADQASNAVDNYSGILGSFKGLIIQNFGENGLIAAYVILSALIMFVGLRLAKTTFSMVKYLLFPAVALAVIGSFVLPYSFLALLPITTTFGAVFLLIKG